MHTVRVIAQGSTRFVDPADRVDFWEEHNRRHLVGLTCTSYDAEGLWAAGVNYELGDLRLADISGGAHVIERTPELCRTEPKDAVFASLLVDGTGFFYHGDGYLTLAPGDLVLYDTRRPYLFGFTGPMRQLLLDIPRSVFTDRYEVARGSFPLLMGKDPDERALLRSELAALMRMTVTRQVEDPQRLQDRTLDVLGGLATGMDAVSASSHLRLAGAKAYVDRHLGSPALSVDRVAAVAGVSVRHLARLFEPEGTTPARYIAERRLRRAREQLRDPAHSALTIADVAHRWGFASHAHFTRAFRRAFGEAPRDVRPERP
ncbi:helix-turn-helix domain-containing protein [Spiractinospora alimapuensis]|uniref:helix-turn-helix domain-containing protein n=1 Tax=Spiractinospora alimapuensis TaxID=2820884 RepID=UPI001F311B9F|nr:helix-turn-helix domain-containing protein [Spiractinospora alimapuensis]QVQ50565.1 helix-turn-helix domain-containing protein [Spiractinospora alimapuensis]